MRSGAGLARAIPKGGRDARLRLALSATSRARLLRGREGGAVAPLLVYYPIFQVSPETSSFLRSPGPWVEMALCSCSTRVCS